MSTSTASRNDCEHLTPQRTNCSHINFHGMPVSTEFKECTRCPHYRSPQLSMFSGSTLDYEYQAQQWRDNNPEKWADIVRFLDGMAWECNHEGRRSISVRQAEMKLADKYHEAVNHNFTKHHGNEYKRIRPQNAPLIKTRN